MLGAVTVWVGLVEQGGIKTWKRVQQGARVLTIVMVVSHLGVEHFQKSSLTFLGSGEPPLASFGSGRRHQSPFSRFL